MAPGGSTSPSSAGAPLGPTQLAVHTLARRIVRAPLVEVDGTLCRAVRAEYLRRSPPEPLYYRGSLQGGRYTPPGGPAGLYSRVEGQDRAFTLALRARAAADGGDRREYEEAWSTAWLAVDYDLSGTHSPALLELARAAARQQDWPRMQQASRLYGLQPRASGPDRNTEQLSELLRLARQPG